MILKGHYLIRHVIKKSMQSKKEEKIDYAFPPFYNLKNYSEP